MGSEDETKSGHHIVRADEVDQTGTDISPMPDDQLMPNLVRDFKAEQSRKLEEEFPEFPQRHPKPPVRPELRPDVIVPPPPLQPPPPAPSPQNIGHPTDSLSLAQLRKIVQDFPKSEQQPVYAFHYADTEPFSDELNEWFQYTEVDQLMLLGSKSSFEQSWYRFSQSLSKENTSETSWLLASESSRRGFMEMNMSCLSKSKDLLSRIEALETTCYLVTGVWGLTAGKVDEEYPLEPTKTEAEKTPKNMSLQIRWMEKNVDLFRKTNGIYIIFNHLQSAFELYQTTDQDDMKTFGRENSAAAYFSARDRELNLILTIFYLIIEVARREETLHPDAPYLRNALAALKPSYLAVVTRIIARLRWEDVSKVPLTRLILLFWKSILLSFGGSDSLKRAKASLEPQFDAKASSSKASLPILTASPLDYQTFRQEIMSKYPAYNPPPPLFALELENNSILPPPPNVSMRVNQSTIFPGGSTSFGTGNGSILNKSVHIATPAPSPPPSPGGPGKSGKKQNYQTNQNFPFMYPPLDSASNNIGGKGSSGLQDTLVGQKWEGGDVPASIIEAGKLFSSRTRMTRSIRQLWEAREQFMKYDRGWDADTDAASLEHQENNDDNLAAGTSCLSKETDDEDVQRRLDAVEDFYVWPSKNQILPNLQSVIIVMLKEILTNITAAIGTSDGDLSSNDYKEGPVMNDVFQLPANAETKPSHKLEELGDLRCREIKSKAISGVLLLLLKWFKRSHILKMEYMTQLLLDSNYLPLILKMLIHKDLDKSVAQKNDRQNQSFFHFCHLHSDQPPEFDPTPEIRNQEDSEDEAVPPPISRSRSSLSVLHSGFSKEPVPDQTSLKDECLPEVNELGFPTAPLPIAPITDFSFRNFFSAINYLHIMQKITRDKAHRCLLLVQYKSSAVLHAGIKIPNPDLRLYTLKLFKSQVPYCGRKWRQSHMRIITAIYLYCRPELRDDWLAGADIDAEVENSLPMEQALRGLTHWWHMRQYKDAMAVEGGQVLMDEERDFFSRELETMGWGFAGEEICTGTGDDVNGVGVDGRGGGLNDFDPVPW
ncbi:Factor arrest protein 11 [Ophidiomyces ophidiicola]|nr:Factor arrest protein 11 [Ophidiomyces ophidiicola]